MEQQDFALRLGQLREAGEEFLLTLAADEPVARVIGGVRQQIGEFLDWLVVARRLAPVLGALLPGDSEEPRAELGVIAQAGEVARGGDERLLHDVQRGLVVADKFGDVGIQRQLMPPKEGVPRVGVAATGGAHGRLFRLGHGGHRCRVECGSGGKVQRDGKVISDKFALASRAAHPLITNYFSRPALYFFRVWKVRRCPVLGTDTL